jgi:hypothetical protein
MVPEEEKASVSLKKILNEVVYHQKRKGLFIELPEGARNDNNQLEVPASNLRSSNASMAKEESSQSQLFEEEAVPTNLKPLMNKEVNFKLYCDMLMKKTDKQRINIDINDFANIKFSNFGTPEIVIRLFSFLAQEDP